MKLRIKLLFCAVLAVVAVLSLLATLGGIGALDAFAESEGWLLREYEGCVGVFGADGGDEPQRVTDIRVSTLPLQDRLALAAGVSAKDEDSLQLLLEDLGS